MVREEESLANKMDRLIEAVEKKEEKGDKKFKLPLGTRGRSKLKKNYVLVFIIRNNGNILIKFLPIINSMIYLKENDTYHAADTDYIGYYKSYPAMIVPEWSLEPLSRAKHIDETMKNKFSSDPQKVIINAVKMAQLKKPALAGGKVLWIIIGLAVVGYLIYQQSVGATP